MYLGGDDYDRMAKLVIDIFIDYNITSFPVDEKEICRKLGIKLVPYSAYSRENRRILMKKSKDAFYAPATEQTPSTIFYNDLIESYDRIRFSIFHEIKHYVDGDKDDNKYNDSLADYFARYFMVPIPYLIHNNVDDLITIISDHEVSNDAANNALRNVRNRRKRYGSLIFDYEKPLIELFSRK